MKNKYEYSIFFIITNAKLPHDLYFCVLSMSFDVNFIKYTITRIAKNVTFAQKIKSYGIKIVCFSYPVIILMF